MKNKKIRLLVAGTIVWALVVTSFSILGAVPALKNSLNQQAFIVSVLIIPYAFFGASVYYKNGNTDNGLVTGLIMSLTALLLDALITVPFIEIPNGGSYRSFYTYPLLWLLVVVNMTSVAAYWKLRVKQA